MALGTEVGLDPGHIVLDGDTAPLPKKGHPQFLAHVYCGQTAGWIKTPLGTGVDLGPGHFVLDGFPAIGERGTCILWPRSPISATAELLLEMKVKKSSNRIKLRHKLRQPITEK